MWLENHFNSILLYIFLFYIIILFQKKHSQVVTRVIRISQKCFCIQKVPFDPAKIISWLKTFIFYLFVLFCLYVVLEWLEISMTLVLGASVEAKSCGKSLTEIEASIKKLQNNLIWIFQISSPQFVLFDIFPFIL